MFYRSTDDENLSFRWKFNVPFTEVAAHFSGSRALCDEAPLRSLRQRIKSIDDVGRYRQHYTTLLYNTPHC